MALWQNGRKYPAVVQKMDPDGSVSVQFYDGYVKSVRPINVRRLLASDSDFVKDCKEQQTLLEQQMLVTNGGTEALPNPKQPISLAKALSPEPLGNLSESAGPSKAKRERKSKFNVREVLNLKEASPKVTNMKDGLPSSKSSPALKPTSSSAPKLLKSSNPAERLDSAANSESFERSDKVFDVEQDFKSEVKNAEQQEDSQTGDIEVVDLSESYDVKSMSEGGCSVSETGSEGTPSEKENINCENSDNINIKSSATDSNGIVGVSNGTNGLSEMIRGKRARKRKRFADEELGEGQSAKHQRSLSNTSESSKLHSNSSKPLSTSTGSPVKLEQVVKDVSKLQARLPHTSPSPRPLTSAQRSLKGARSPSKSDPRAGKSKRRAREKARLEETRRDSEARTLVTPQNNNSTTSSNGASEPAALLLKTPAYLNFDFSLPPDQLLAHLEEGVTVPGPTTPLTMASPKLPVGWTKRVSLRSAVSGLLTKWDVTIESPEGRSFRNRQELSRHFEEARLEHNLDLFDFGLDTPLKKIRQIWKANLPVPQDNNKMSSPTSNSAPVSSSLPNATPLSSAMPTPSPEQKPRKPLRLPASDQERQKLEITMRVGPLSPGTPVIGNASETGQGVRCPLKKCNKLFRNERLLLQHVKHYHPEYTEVVGYSPSVTDLAFQRTRLREEVSDRGGILLETLRKAEKKVEKVDKSVERTAKIEKVEKLEKAEKVEKVEKKVERSSVVTTVCTTPTPVVEVQELRRSLAAANGDSCETSVTSKAPSTASKVTSLATSKSAMGNHRGLVSTVESTTPALSEEENSTTLQAPPKRLSVDVRRSGVIFFHTMIRYSFKFLLIN